MIFERLAAGLFSLVGVELDFSFDPHGDLFCPINPTLHVGACPGPEDVRRLEAAGITHVVSCLEDTQRSRVAFLEDHFDPLFIAVRDGMHHDLASAFPRFFDFAARARSAGKLLVHCEKGVSRSATLATALLMTSERMTFFEAYCAVRARRPGALPNIGFASQLQRLERQLHPGVSAGRSSLVRYLREVCHVPVEIELLQDMLERHDHDAPRALRAIFGDDLPRVVQGVRL